MTTRPIWGRCGRQLPGWDRICIRKGGFVYTLGRKCIRKGGFVYTLGVIRVKKTPRGGLVGSV